MSLHIVLPATSGDVVSEYLAHLAEQVCKSLGEDYSMGSYGATYENDVFAMHRYCWCEQAGCAWCVGCHCGEDWETNPCASCKNESIRAPNFIHKATGAEVRWYKYIGRGMEVSEADWPTIIRECIASLEPRYTITAAGRALIAGTD